MGGASESKNLIALAGDMKNTSAKQCESSDGRQVSLSAQLSISAVFPTIR
jgi:hypothetical protein